MAFPPPRTVPRYLRRLAPAVLLAAAATLGGSAFGDPATADAKPKVWDQESYGVCAQQAYDDYAAGKINKKTYQELVGGCCILSGGKWVTDIGAAGGSCVAPADAQTQPTLPGLATQTLEPAPPPPIWNPGVVTQTFVPAPANPG